MSITVGLAKAINRVLKSDPRVHAVLEVKVGNTREWSSWLISSSSRGGIGMIGSVAMMSTGRMSGMGAWSRCVCPSPLLSGRSSYSGRSEHKEAIDKELAFCWMTSMLFLL